MNQTIKKILDPQNNTVTYQCNGGETNVLTPVNVTYFYDFLYQGNDFNASLAVIESNLLRELANDFGLIDGTSCNNPSISTVGSLWLTSISSLPVDQLDTNYQRCVALSQKNLSSSHGDNMSCVVVRGQMTGLAVNPPSTGLSFFTTKIAQAMISSVATNGTNDMVVFLGTNLDQPSVLGTNNGNGGDAPSNAIAGNSNTQDNSSRSVTILGGVLASGFCLAILGVAYFLYQRRKRFVTARDVELALSKSDSRMGEYPNHSKNDDDDDEVPTLPQDDALSDDMDVVHDNQYSNHYNNKGNNRSSSSHHAFDLGQSFRNELMGIHGRHTSLPRGMDEVSDAGSGSDADSWAQTDGTIGSLEQQLDPITAEV